MTTENKLNLTNILGIEDIDDALAESYSAGAFRFAVSQLGSSEASTITSVTGTTTIEPVTNNDEFVRLNTTTGGGNRFALAIHDARTGENLDQIFSAADPAIHGQLIEVENAIANIRERRPNAPLQYRVRQFEAPAVNEGNSQCFFGCLSTYNSSNFK